MEFLLALDAAGTDAGELDARSSQLLDAAVAAAVEREGHVVEAAP